MILVGALPSCERSLSGPTTSRVASIRVNPAVDTLRALGAEIQLGAVAQDAQGADGPLQQHLGPQDGAESPCPRPGS